MAEKEQRSREFGVKFAKALRAKAGEAASEYDLDARYIVLGAAEYLRRDAELRHSKSSAIKNRCWLLGAMAPKASNLPRPPPMRPSRWHCREGPRAARGCRHAQAGPSRA